MGTAIAVALALLEAHALGASAPVELAICLASVIVFLALAFGTKAIMGSEVLIYYHHEIAVLTVAAVVCATAGVAAGRYLDATAVGLGACLAVGRLGCAAAGCCHGRPAAWGVV
jgi:hypothetical protein